MKPENQNLIDIEKVVRSKTNKRVPKFIINYLKKIVHETEINDCILHATHPEGIFFFKEALDYLDISFEVNGLENLPAKGRFMFVANHPLGGPEALILGEIFRQHFGESFRVPVNNILAHFHPLKQFFVPINIISNKQDRSLSVLLNDMFNSDYQVLVFPAGKCARKIHGKVTEMPWKKMFVSRAKASQRDIIPIHFSGRNSNFFYFLCKLSDVLHLKLNIGMLFLADELFKQQHKHFIISFGETISWQSLDKNKTDLQWAAQIREKCLKLNKT